MTMGTGMWICFCCIIMKYTSDCEVKCDLDLFLINSFLAHQSKSLCLAFRVWRLFSESRYLRRRSRAAVLHRSWSPCTTIWSRSSTPPATTSGRVCCEPCAPVCLKSVWDRLNMSRCVSQVTSIYAAEWPIYCTGKRLNVPLFWLEGDYPGGCIYCVWDFTGLPKPYCPPLV